MIQGHGRLGTVNLNAMPCPTGQVPDCDATGACNCIPTPSTATTTTPPTFTSSFLTSAEAWQTPSAGITATEGVFSNLSTAFSSSNIGTTMGTLAVPLLLIWLVLGMSKGR